jgi:hypothetical protein
MQDVVPEQLIEFPDSNALMRRYLDAGGTIVWFGDTPCFFKGKKGKASTNDLSNEDGTQYFFNTAFATVLGILPVISSPLGPVKITKKGKGIGLSTIWSGMRPILKDKSIKTLAESTSLFASEIIDARRMNIFKQIFDRVQSVKIGGTGAELALHHSKEKSGPFDNKITAFTKYSNAWFKNYNHNIPYSGFYRIWDYIIPDYMAKSKSCELNTILKRIISRLKLDVQE